MKRFFKIKIQHRKRLVKISPNLKIFLSFNIYFADQSKLKRFYGLIVRIIPIYTHHHHFSSPNIQIDARETILCYRQRNYRSARNGKGNHILTLNYHAVEYAHSQPRNYDIKKRYRKPGQIEAISIIPPNILGGRRHIYIGTVALSILRGPRGGVALRTDALKDHYCTFPLLHIVYNLFLPNSMVAVKLGGLAPATSFTSDKKV